VATLVANAFARRIKNEKPPVMADSVITGGFVHSILTLVTSVADAVRAAANRSHHLLNRRFTAQFCLKGGQCSLFHHFFKLWANLLKWRKLNGAHVDDFNYVPAVL